MKLVYTDIRTPLTQVLVDEANRLVAEGKRVFYIAPNSLSFEKERKVLQLLDQKASFAYHHYALCSDGTLFYT